MKPRIPSASLSQSVAVDETVLPAASQNITAYAVNTEPSQGYDNTVTSQISIDVQTPVYSRRLCLHQAGHLQSVRSDSSRRDPRKGTKPEN